MDQIVPGWLSIEELVRHRMESFHRERVQLIADGAAPFPLVPGGKLVVHLIPEDAVRTSKRYTASDLKARGGTFLPFGEQSGLPRFNADGFATFSGTNQVEAYTQLFRDGCLEAVTTEITYTQGDSLFLRLGWLERVLIDLVKQHLGFCSGIGINPPAWIFTTLIGCQGARSSAWQGYGDVSISRSLVFLPSLVIESLESDPITQLRPLFDCLANVTGFERSPNYDEQGNRREHRAY